MQNFIPVHILRKRGKNEQPTATPILAFSPHRRTIQISNFT